MKFFNFEQVLILKEVFQFLTVFSPILHQFPLINNIKKLRYAYFLITCWCQPCMYEGVQICTLAVIWYPSMSGDGSSGDWWQTLEIVQ